MAVGVKVNVAPPAAAGGLVRNASATFFVAGLTQRGRSDRAVLVRSLNEYVSIFGDRVSYGAVYDALAAYFSEGGTRAYVARTVGGAAASGTSTFNDRDSGSPLPSLQFDAVGEGAWSSNLTVEIRDGVITDTFDVLIAYNGESVETFLGLTSPSDAANRINQSSTYVAVTNLGSPAVAPDNNPDVAAPTALSAGTDDRASVGSSSYVLALDLFTSDLGPGVVAIPGQPETAVAAGIGAHCVTNRRLGFLSLAFGTGVGGASSAAAALRATSGAKNLAIMYPWVQVPDGAGGVRDISPEGYAAGVRARTISLVGGTWRAAAGEISAARHITGIEASLTPDEVDTLNDDAVNPIRFIAGSIRLYGWRSLSSDLNNYKFLTAQDMINDIAWAANALMEQFVFRTIDGRGLLFTEVENELRSVLEPMRQAGGLYQATDGEGNILDNGYLIDTGPGVNTPATIAAGEVRAAISIRVSPVGELVRVIITKVALDASL